MNTYRFLLLAFLGLILNFGNLNAKEKIYTVEGHYKHFAYNYSPKELLQSTQKVAIWISDECKISKERCDQAIDELNKPVSKWAKLDAKEPILIIVEKKTGSIIAHPNPKLHKIRFIKNLAQKFKDNNGVYVMLDAFKKLDQYPFGAWFSQYSTWIRSQTNLAKPLYSLCVLVSIPESTYQVQKCMPYRANSIKEIESKIADLESYYEEWSIMK